ncbi:MAG: class I adenylate-forming enzyme family protein [Eubacteriales bacterium]|nr:class I adenylate-forming enzyme family protein [Eubacteriales bacterium]
MDSIVECISRYAASQPEKRCILDGKVEKTYGEYWDYIRRMASVLGTYAKSGECVVVEASQSVVYLACEMGLQLLQGIFVPLERKCVPGRILDIAVQTNARLIITDQDLVCDIPVIGLKDLDKMCSQAEPIEHYDFPSRAQEAEILFSTGTTGKPKGIRLTHGNDIALAENVKFGVEMGSDNLEIIPVPLNHSHGLRRYYGNMFNGSSVILMDGILNIKKFFKYLDEYPVTALDLVPSSLSIIFKLSKDKLGDYRDQLDYVQLGAAPLPEEDKETLCRLLPDTRLYNFYGSTESGCCCILDFNKDKGMTGCIGRSAVNAEFLLVDDQRRPVGKTDRENPGLLAIKGGMNMLGYYQDEEETAKVMSGPYIYTNDIAYMEDGYVYLLGRKGDVINVGGNKVSPEEVEEAALKFPGIAECACVPAEDKIQGQVPRLFIVSENEVDKGELSVFLSGKLEAYKVPKHIVAIDKIPRTFNGKIKRKELMSY